jgi:ferric iron reductase protein FhuF
MTGSALLKDLFRILTGIVVETWTRERRVLDVSLANLLVDLSSLRPRFALHRARVAVIQGDKVEGARVVADERALLDLIGEWLLEDTVRRLIAAYRNVAHIGDRHLWGNVANAAANAFISADRNSESRLDRDRRIFFERYPELASHIELVTISDGADGRVTCVVRHNCCLRIKLPDVDICLNCSLLDRKDVLDMYEALYACQRGPSPRDEIELIRELVKGKWTANQSTTSAEPKSSIH